MKKNTSYQWIVPLILIIFGFSARLLPHPPNFAPIGALALFGGIYLPRRLALVIPLGAMILSDLIIGFYSLPIMLSVYGSFALMNLIGLWVRGRKRFSTVLGGTLCGSTLFFLITNAAVWAFSGIYPFTLSGLAQSYIMAIPFFRSTVLGDLFYVGLLMGSYEYITYWIKHKEAATQTQHI
ncbi:MAG: hypothetical protein HY001_01975 [Candidatus Portnoybacteria bacterium]|nr:hypothetical protein [Candidatus Portnoybacteria bacterium]